jgi:FKBP-type peptidyl-prolyl cis-trans isomerase FklB
VYGLNVETLKVGAMVIRVCALFVFLTASVPVIAQDAAAEKTEAPKTEAPKLETTIQKASYAIGFNFAKKLQSDGLTPDAKALTAGMAAALADEKSALSPKEIQAVFEELGAEMQKAAEAKAVKNLEIGKAFLEENKKKDGIKVTKSGLQYLVIKEGTGATPTKASTVTAHYRGTFLDGEKFDSSYAGDEPTADEKPFTRAVTGVIPGWTEALQLMKVGAKYRLFVPSDLAYGEAGVPGIPPNSVLIFDIELVASK